MRSDYQLDFFATAKGGVAICLRYGLPGDYRIMVYDGGSIETGKEIVRHVHKRYGTDVVNDLVCSHPHADHAMGLWPIMEGLEVRQLWMHRPWEHSSIIAHFFRRARCPDPALSAHFEEKMAITFALEEAALARNIPVIEPFQGMQIGPMTVMSPHRDWYVHRLMSDFEDPPPAKRRMSPELMRLLRQVGVQFPEVEDSCLAEAWDVETLTERGNVSAEMESSVVLHGLVGGHGILLTGNAGIRALSNTAAYADHERIFVPANLKFLQVPRHGDSNHVSPSVLDRLIGSKLPEPSENPRAVAFVATPFDCQGYPHQSVINALSRRGVTVTHAAGKGNSFYRFAAGEDGGRIEILPFSGGSR